MKWIPLKGNSPVGNNPEQIYLIYPDYRKALFIENNFKQKSPFTDQFKIIKNVTHYIKLMPPK